MNCPVCQNTMVEKDFGGVKVDVCVNGCKGIWFDWAELVKLDEKNEGFGEALTAALAFQRTNDEERGQIACPKCGIPMHTHKYKSSKEVNVDECYVCGGFFLDSGELKTIRDTFMSEEEEAAYADKLIQDMPVYREAQKDLAAEKTRSQAAKRLTRFLRVSYYVTGK